MGFLDFIFGKKAVVENEFFGTMRFFECKKAPHESYFECSRHFKPTGKTIEMAVDGGRSGAAEKQKAFFKRIEDNWETVCRAVAPAVEREMANCREDFRITDFQKQFEAVYLSIPRCETEPVVWEITFETKLVEADSFAATMSGFEVKHILIDG